MLHRGQVGPGTYPGVERAHGRRGGAGARPESPGMEQEASPGREGARGAGGHVALVPGVQSEWGQGHPPQRKAGLGDPAERGLLMGLFTE